MIALTSPMFTMLSSSKTCTVSARELELVEQEVAQLGRHGACRREIEIRSPRRRRFSALS